MALIVVAILPHAGEAREVVEITERSERRIEGPATVRLGNGVEIRLGSGDSGVIAYDPGANFFKVAGLSGTMTVKRLGRLGEKQWLKGGEMMFGDPRATSLPGVVKFHLPTFLATSPALREAMRGDDPAFPPGRNTSMPGTMSGGERRRMAIGSAIINNPEIEPLDEPTGGLDPKVREEILRALRDQMKDLGKRITVGTPLVVEGPGSQLVFAPVFDLPASGDMDARAVPHPDDDINRDGMINRQDYADWRNAFRESAVLGEDGDFNPDGVVDAGDYTVWRNASPDHFPTRPDPVPSSDLFAIDYTNRNQLAAEGNSNDRFNPVIPTYQIEAFTQLKIPESHGFDTRFPASTSRGIPTLPDGTDVFPDSPPVGGIGVSFPVQPGSGTNYLIDSTSVIEVNRVLTASYPTLAATNLGFFRTYEANGNLLVTGAVDDFTNAGNTYASLLFQSSGNLDLDNAVVDTTNASFVPIAPGIGFQTTGGNLRVVDSTINAPNNVGILLDNRSGGSLLVESSTLVSDRAVTVSNQLDENNQPTNGTVTLRGADIDAPQQVNLQSGGDLEITDNGAPTTIDGNSILAQSFSGGVRVASSSDLSALTDLIIQASSNGDVAIDNSTLQAGNQLLIEAIRPNNPLLRIDGSTLHANVIRARALGNGAVVRVNAANLTAITQLNLFADGANSLLHFTGNTTLTSPVLNLAGQEVRIDSGASVTTSTAPNVFTDQPNYNQVGYGSFSQPPNTQPYNSRPGF